MINKKRYSEPNYTSHLSLCDCFSWRPGRASPGRPRSHAPVKVMSMNIHRTEIICWILVFVSSAGLSEEQSVYQQVDSYVEQLWEEGRLFFWANFCIPGPHSVFVNWLFSPAAYFLHLNFIRITCLQETAGRAVPRKAPAAKGVSRLCATSVWNAREMDSRLRVGRAVVSFLLKWRKK